MKEKILILKADANVSYAHIQRIRDDVINQMEDGVAVIPFGFSYSILDCGFLEHGSRFVNIDEWINKLKRITNDPACPGEYKDYCMHLISEVEAEFQAQQPEGE